MKINNIRRLAVLLSILFHLLLILLFQKAEQINLLFSDIPEIEEPEKRLTFQLVETPENILEEEPTSESDLVSDKNTKAKDNNSNESPILENPYSEGELAFQEYEQPEVDPQPETENTIQTPNDQKDQEENLNPITEKNIEDELISYNDQNPDPKESGTVSQEEIRKRLSFENLISNAADKGGISFNTYNWNFAPYMLAMKKRIESNWHPPYAFTHMGAISGVNSFRFTVMPDGRVKDLKMLETNAHYSLDQSSSGAIKQSSPFMPLPVNFPEEYLVVTVTFSYNIYKNK